MGKNISGLFLPLAGKPPSLSAPLEIKLPYLGLPLQSLLGTKLLAPELVALMVVLTHKGVCAPETDLAR
jgi:hypothetical protein